MELATTGAWHQVARERHPSHEANEGLATWERRGGTTLVYRGSASVPKEFADAGIWVHIGDPDAHGGVLVDCYQGERSARAKMFRSTVATSGAR